MEEKCVEREERGREKKKHKERITTEIETAKSVEGTGKIRRNQEVQEKKRNKEKGWKTKERDGNRRRKR